MERNIQLIIPMSGIGKRFINDGYTDPKPLIDVDGHPIIKHVLNLFPGVKDVTFICNEYHIKNTNMESVLRNISKDCKIYEVPNNDRRGPVDAVNKVSQYIKDDSEVIVSYCDYGTYWNFDDFLKNIDDNKLDGSIACYKGFHPHMLGSDNYAFCKVDDLNNLLEIKEKESFTNNKMNEYASNGTYYFKSGKILKKYFKELVDLNMNVNNEYYVSLVYNLLVRDGLKVGIFGGIENMLQWGTPYDLEIYKGWSKYFSNIKNFNNTIKHDDNVTLVLPMAGRGSRFSDEGFDLPKPLIDVDGKPMIIKAIECLPKTKNNSFICLEEHIDKYGLDKTLKDYDKNCSILKISETTEGQACTCEMGIDFSKINLEDPILISACDNGVCYDEYKYFELVNDLSNDVIVWSFRNNQSSKVNPNMYAWLDVDENNVIKHVSCKKFIYDDPLKTHAIIGTMFFRKAKYFMEGLKMNYVENIRTNNEFYVDDVLNQNIKKMGLKVKVFEVENYICWGTPNDYKTYVYWKEYFEKINKD